MVEKKQPEVNLETTNPETPKYMQGSMYYEIYNDEIEELATVGAGCYWGPEKFYVKNFQ